MENSDFIDNKKLQEIRDNTDWRLLFSTLGLELDPKKTKPDDWWACSPFADEKTPSFHLNDKGFYCFATGRKGGVVELVQQVMNHRGTSMSCYEAGRWLLSNNVSRLVSHEIGRRSEKGKRPKGTGVEATRTPSQAQEKPKENPVIRFNLVPCFSQQGTHPEFVRRGISAETCHRLRCGYLERSNGFLRQRLVFQIRGIRTDAQGNSKSVILSHIGRATTLKQEAEHGKWCHYAKFSKSLELYHLDRLILDPEAQKQALYQKEIVLLEGCFDVAKAVEAGLHNVVATFGAQLAASQIPRFEQIWERLGINRVRIAYDPDEAGVRGTKKAIEALRTRGFEASSVDWNQLKRLSQAEDIGDFPVAKLILARQEGLI